MEHDAPHPRRRYRQTRAPPRVRTGDLAAALASRSVDGYAGEAVAFSDPAQVHAAGTKSSVGKINITVSGNGSIVWQFDKSALLGALVGKKKDAFESIITSFRPALVGADAKVLPFWMSTFPSSPDKITVTVGAKK